MAYLGSVLVCSTPRRPGQHLLFVRDTAPHQSEQQLSHFRHTQRNKWPPPFSRRGGGTRERITATTANQLSVTCRCQPVQLRPVILARSFRADPDAGPPPHRGRKGVGDRRDRRAEFPIEQPLIGRHRQHIGLTAILQKFPKLTVAARHGIGGQPLGGQSTRPGLRQHPLGQTRLARTTPTSARPPHRIAAGRGTIPWAGTTPDRPGRDLSPPRRPRTHRSGSSRSDPRCPNTAESRRTIWSPS
jgi:hypothetical protein